MGCLKLPYYPQMRLLRSVDEVKASCSFVTTPDPLAEMFAWQSPYVYAANNPVKYIDYRGLAPRTREQQVRRNLLEGSYYAGIEDYEPGDPFEGTKSLKDKMDEEEQERKNKEAEEGKSLKQIEEELDEFVAKAEAANLSFFESMLVYSFLALESAGNRIYETYFSSGKERNQAMLFLQMAMAPFLLNPKQGTVRRNDIGTQGAARGGVNAIKAGEYTITKTVANNLATRPYINSPSTITNIMKSGKGVPDVYFKGGMNYKVSGTYNGSSGIWELGINPETNTIYHFLFRTVK